MPDIEFIHSLQDVTSTLTYAIDNGLKVVIDEPLVEPRLVELSREDVSFIDKGIFNIYRSEWIKGPIQFVTISSGHYYGRYTVSPRVNWFPITAYFQGERIDEGRRRFGSGNISWNRRWLEYPSRNIQATPDCVQDCYRELVAHLSSGTVVAAGVHKYHLAKNVIADPSIAASLPPFDFIPWQMHGTHQNA